jgi:hypothetical protein
MKIPSTKFYALFFTICWVGLVVGLLLGQPVVQALFGAPIALVLPGLLIVYLLKMTPVGLERASLIVSLSVAVLIACVLVESLTPAGIQAVRTLGLLAAVTVVLTTTAAAVAAIRSRSRHNPNDICVADQPPPPEPDLSGAEPVVQDNGNRPVRAVVVWLISGAMVAGAAVGALALSAASEQTSAAPDFTQLSITRQPDPSVYRLEVVNLEGVPTQYQLQIVRPGTPRTVHDFVLQPAETFGEDISVRRPGRYNEQIVATLYGGSVTPLGYRQVTVTIPKQPIGPMPRYVTEPK